jgi:hypothetical protein
VLQDEVVILLRISPGKSRNETLLRSVARESPLALDVAVGAIVSAMGEGDKKELAFSKRACGTQYGLTGRGKN